MKTLLFLLSISFSASSLFGQTPAHLIRDIRPGDAYNSTLVFIDELTAAGDRLFFSGAECMQSPEIYTLKAGEDSLYLPKNVWPETFLSFCGTDPIYHFSRARQLTAVDSQVFYVIDHPDYGRELWVTDGTLTGSTLVRDFASGSADSDPEELTSALGRLWFTAVDGGGIRALWSSDGATAGTEFISVLNPAIKANPSALDSSVYFTAELPGQGIWLWRTDGTAAGTQNVVAISVAGMPDAVPVSLQAVDGALYLVMHHDATAAALLYRLTPPDWQPTLLDTFHAAYALPLYLPSRLVKVDSLLYFAATQSATGRELWRTDGTPTGTALAANIRPGTASSHPYDLVVYHDKLYFNARVSNTKTGIFRFAGDSTVQLLTPGASEFSGGWDLLVWDDYLWFRAANDAEIWRSDGTVAGTQPVTTGLDYSTIDQLRRVGDGLYFRAIRNDTLTIWKSTGVPGAPAIPLGGTIAEPASSGGRRSTRMGNEVYFWIAEQNYQYRLWRSDGTTAGTYSVTGPTTDYSGGPVMHVIDDSVLIYRTTSPYQLWRTNGTPGAEQSFITLSALSSYGQSDGRYIYFTANAALYRTDGTAAGTILLKAGVSSFGGFIRLNGYSYAWVKYQNDTHLMKTDGTSDGTVLLVNATEGPISTVSMNLVVFDSALYFFRELPDTGWGLWRTDGTTTGTLQVASLNPPGYYAPYSLVATSGRLFFVANDGVSGAELWQSDGTAAGTHLAVDLNPAPGIGGALSGLAAFGERVVFSRSDTIHGEELWMSDGTAAGTALVRDIVPGRSSSSPTLSLHTAVLDTLFFFTAFTEDFGRELWQSDGTEAGTVMVQDICLGPCSSAPEDLLPLGPHRFFFRAYDRAAGYEPWIYDPLMLSGLLPSRGAERPGTTLRLFPNPAGSGVVTVEWLDGDPAMGVELIDLYGRVVAQVRLEGQRSPLRLSLPDLSTGVYAIRLLGRAGQVFGAQKLIISRH